PAASFARAARSLRCRAIARSPVQDPTDERACRQLAVRPRRLFSLLVALSCADGALVRFDSLDKQTGVGAQREHAEPLFAARTKVGCVTSRDAASDALRDNVVFDLQQLFGHARSFPFAEETGRCG